MTISRVIKQTNNTKNIGNSLGQVRELRYDSSRHFDLDDVLLIFGQIGLMAYNIFTVIAGYYTMNEDEDGALVLLSALAALFQVKATRLFSY